MPPSSSTWQFFNYALISFCSSALNNVFVTYFFSASMGTCVLNTTAPLSPYWFFFGQLLYACWNATNDPLAGYWSDSRGGNTLQRRSTIIKWGGLAWGVFFALSWFPPTLGWGVALVGRVYGPWLSSALTGIHFLLSLCCYDGALTLVEVNHGALLTEIRGGGAEGEGDSIDDFTEAVNRQRVRANAWVAGAMALGAITSLPAHKAWEADCALAAALGGLQAPQGGAAAASPHTALMAWRASGWWPGYFRTFALSLALVCVALFWVASQGILGGGGGGAAGGGGDGSGGGGESGGLWDGTASATFFTPLGKSRRGVGTPQGLASMNNTLGGDVEIGVNTPGLRHRTALKATTAQQQQQQHDRSLWEGGGESGGGGGGGGEIGKVMVSDASPHLLPTFAGGGGLGGGVEGGATGMGIVSPQPHLLPPIPPPPSPYYTFVSSLLALPTARSYVTLASLQSFDCSFGKSFYSLFLATLWLHAFGGISSGSGGSSGGGGGGSSASPLSTLPPPPTSGLLPFFLGLFTVRNPQALLIFASFLLPHAVTLLVEPCVNTRGIVRVLRGVFLSRFYLCLCVGTVSMALYATAPTGSLQLLEGGSSSSSTTTPPPHTSMIALLSLLAIGFQLVSRVSSETVCRNMSLLKAAMVDEWRENDAQQQQQQQQQLRDTPGGGGNSSTVGLSSEVEGSDKPAALIGAADFFPRVASSIAPMLGYALFLWGGGGGGGGGASSSSSSSPTSSSSSSTLSSLGLLWLGLIAVPATITGIQAGILREVSSTTSRV